MNRIKGILSTQLPAEAVFHVGMLAFRIVVAFAMIRIHGIKKIVDIEGEIAHMPDPLGLGGELNAYIAIAINIFFAGFVGLGFLTRLFALGILPLTLMGLFVVHWQDPWPMKDAPLMYSMAFGLIALLGPGKYSIDHSLNKSL